MPGAAVMPQSQQLPLPGFEALKGHPRRIARRRSTAEDSAQRSPDPLVDGYRSQLAAQGVAPQTLAAYRYQLRAILLNAARLAGRMVTCVELFRDPGLLGRVLIEDTAPTRGTQLSRWTLAQRRSAIRSFATLMRPELLVSLGEEPAIRLDRALQAVATRMGTGYRLTGGTPRRRGGSVPTAADVAAMLEAAAAEPGYAGRRDRAFFAILAATGARVNALRELDGADCVTMPAGQLRLFLHEKGKAEPREVELDRDLAAALRAYADAFNLQAARGHRAGRVRFGQPGAIWRGAGSRRWSYAAVLSTLRAACRAAGVPAFSPHALRRFFATEAASALPRHVVALAGGWQGVERLDDHYIRPHTADLWAKLERSDATASGPAAMRVTDATTAAV